MLKSLLKMSITLCIMKLMYCYVNGIGKWFPVSAKILFSPDYGKNGG